MHLLVWADLLQILCWETGMQELIFMPLLAHLVSCDGHAHLVAHTQQQQTTLCTVDGDLTDQLVKALSIQLLTHRADACLPGLHTQVLCMSLSKPILGPQG